MISHVLHAPRTNQSWGKDKEGEEAKQGCNGGDIPDAALSQGGTLGIAQPWGRRV